MVIKWEWTNNPLYNRGIYTPEAGGVDSKLAIGMEPGKAYVQGYEIEKIGTEYVEVDKARDYNRVDDSQVQVTVGNYVLVTNLHNIPRFDQFQQISLCDQLTTTAGVVATVSSSTIATTGRLKLLIAFRKEQQP